ncbi:hypothetical protein AAC387_Pa03g3189 [Persea americana]
MHGMASENNEMQCRYLVSSSTVHWPQHIFFFFCAPRTSQKTSLLGSTEFLLWSLLEVYKGGFIRAESAYQC